MEVASTLQLPGITAQTALAQRQRNYDKSKFSCTLMFSSGLHVALPFQYLQSVRPLLDDANYRRMEKLADEFQKGIGAKLQRYLVLKSWWSSNYVSDWWEEYVYLRGRSPLMINSNFYGIDAILEHRSKIQAARAASAIYTFLTFRRLVERQELEPILVQGLVPLCSWQYERIFNTTRIPGIETDKIMHWADSNHIVVYHRGRYFKVIIYKGRILKPCEIQMYANQYYEF